jgi:two-component system response regulator FixJ
MRGMSGVEMLVELRRRGLSIPVIILTAHADTPTTVLAMKNGAFTTLDKPCRDSELWETIRSALHEDERLGEEDRRRQALRQRFDALTQPERDVLKFLAAGEPNKQVAHLLAISLRTVESRKQTVFQKLDIDSIAELVKLVMLVEPDMLPPNDDGGE